MRIIIFLTVLVALAELTVLVALTEAKNGIRNGQFSKQRTLKDSTCIDNIALFRVPNGNFITCEEIKKSVNGFCNVEVIEKKCHVSCKVCPVCTQSKEKIYMDKDHGMKYCSFTLQNSEVCQLRSVNEKCPIACNSCCKDQTGLIPLTSEGGSVECNAFKQDEYRKFCTWTRVRKSCPSACDQCSFPTCSDSKYSVLLKGDITACSADLARTQY